MSTLSNGPEQRARSVKPAEKKASAWSALQYKTAIWRGSLRRESLRSAAARSGTGRPDGSSERITPVR
ncbi:MAG TPA: hypothetical protein VN915_06490 [Elusimicrobiota bacterium]|nr:hypothetical protein [Elusimicrobiota bacterium]